MSILVITLSCHDRSLPSPRRCERCHSLGFTMIEMLVTLTLFALVMSSLVVGLRTGINAHRNLRSHDSQSAAIERATRIIARDLRHLAVINENEIPLEETIEDEGADSERLSFTSLAPRDPLGSGPGSVWARIEYKISQDTESDSKVLIRAYTPHVGNNPMGGGTIEEVLLENVQGLSFDYYNGAQKVPDWEDPEKLPSALEVHIVLESGTQILKTVSIPAGQVQ